ncbi:MAG: c-type cytochrome, partial [Verrucomicrobiota bacterium]|nr:c-type cytochrome [Verrucomicrobiota bacterium]
YPLSPDTTAASYIPSLINKQHSGTYTSASGICIRGKSAFICEPAQNLVQRQVLTPAGATFTAAHPTPDRDFLATPDQWFRPVHATVGPDGALYICDMVRQYIDHPRYLPEDIRAKLPFKAGTNHGRIWRVVLKTPAPPAPTPAQKLAALRNLLIRKGNFPKTPVEELLKQAKSKDATERFLAVLQLATQKHADKNQALLKSLTSGDSGKWMHAAIFNAMEREPLLAAWKMLGNSLPDQRLKNRPDFSRFTEGMGFIAAAESSPDELVKIIIYGAPMSPQPKPPSAVHFSVWERIAFLNGVAEGASKHNRKLEQLLPPKPKLTLPEAKALHAKGKLPAAFSAYSNVDALLKIAAANLRTPFSASRKINSIKLLGHSDFSFASPPLLRLVISDGSQGSPDHSHAIQSAAAQALGALNDKRVGIALLKTNAWGGFRPATRESVLSVVASRSTYHPALMDALEKGTVPVHALSPARRRALERSKTIGARAKKLFAKHAGGDRMKAYEAAQSVLKMKADAANGAKMFTRACALCHTHGGQGHAVGPDLTGLRNQPAATLLMHIIVPNHEVQGGYTLYEVDTKDNQTFAGLLAADTPDQITLKLPLGLTQTLPRKNIKTLRASPKSLMPDQLEKTMTKQELADLLAFLKK